MATLTSTKIKNTYDALLKSIDNDAIGTTAKQITDGLGNVTPLYVSTTQVGIGVTPESGLNLHVFGDAKIGSNLTVIGNLVVEGSTTTVGTDTLTVKDPLIVLANNNTSTDAVDIGFYGKYHPSGTTLYSGLFREALTGKYRLFKNLEVEPTTTVNTSGTGYAQATLIAALEGDVTGNVTGNLTGNVTGGTFSGTLLSNVAATTQSAGDNSTKVATTAYVDNQVGLYDTLSEVLANGNTTGANIIEVNNTSGGIDLIDSAKIRFGTDNDLQLYHNGSNAILYNDTGNLVIESREADSIININCDDGSGGSAVYIQADGASGAVELNHYGSNKFQTTSTGVSVTGVISGLTDPSAAQDAATKNYVDTQIGANNELSEVLANGNTSGANDIIMADNQKIYYGTGSDVEMYFDGATQFGIINDTVGGGIFLRSNSFAFTNGTNEFYSMSSTTHQLKSSGTTRLTVNSTGIDVNGNINIGDNEKIIFGDGGDIEMFFNGSTFVIDDTVEVFGFDIDTNLIRFRGTDLYTEISNAQHTFWTNGTERFKINTTEVKVSHQLNVTGDLIVDTDTLFVDVSTDSVGIGLTNPADYSADELVISVPDDSGMTLVSAATDTAYITFADGTTAAAQSNFISHDHSTDTLTIFSQAKVSIGILEAEVAYFTDTAFFVDKSTTIDDTLTVNGNVEIADSDNTLLYLNSSTANVYLRLDDSGSTNGNFIGATSNDMHFWTNNTERMRIDSNGQVEILNSLVMNAPTGSYIKFEYNSLTRGYIGSERQIFTGGSGDNMGYAATGDLVFGTGSSLIERMRIDSSGNVLINSGYIKLGGYSYIGEDLSDTDSLTIASDHTESIHFAHFTPATSTYSTNMIIDSSGNVGIGTTVPASELQVGGTDLSATANFDAQFAVLSEATTGYPSGFIFKAPRVATSSNRILLNEDFGTYFSTQVYATSTGGAQSDIPIVFAPLGGNVGIGTDSPTAKLDIRNGELTVRPSSSGNGGLGKIGHSSNNALLQLYDSSGTEDVRISTSLSSYFNGGNVGIGISAPGKLLHLLGADATVQIQGSGTSSNAGVDFFPRDGSNVAHLQSIKGVDSSLTFLTGGNSGNSYVPTERMRITSGGTVGNTGSTLLGGGAAEGVTGWNFAPGNGTIITSSDSDSNMYIGKVSGYSNDRFISFYVNGSLVGRITTNGSTTSYVTTSDYRAKENVVEMTGALDRVSQLKPSRFNFIADADTTVDGFLAHEVQEIVPEAISGEKDAMRTEEYEVTPAVYEDVVHPAEEAVYETIEHPAVEEELDDEGNVIVEGKEAYTEEVLVTEAKEEWTEKVLVSEKVMGTREVPDYQGIDQSKLVPLLVGAIQEQQQIINDLKSRIETLENN